MRQALTLLAAIFFPLGTLVRVLDVILAWRDHFDATLNDPAHFHDLRETPDGLRTVEGAIAFGEHWINIIIAARTTELLGLRRRGRLDCRWTGWTPSSPRPYAVLMQRYQRMRRAFATIERHARRRAARIRRMMADPLRLAPPAQSTSPALRAVEATHRALASLSAQHWGRWIGASSRRDGGGRASARGPPPFLHDCPLPTAPGSPASGNAPACLHCIPRIPFTCRS